MITNIFISDEDAFANVHHHIVERFLRQKGLPRNDYYDVVVFGFLRAVRQYFSRTDLQERYAFSTIAYRKMNDDLIKHYKKQARPSRNAVLVNLDDLVSGSDRLTIAEIISGPNHFSDRVEAVMLWEQVSRLLTDEQIEALRLRADGYTDREIAARWKTRVSDVMRIFEDIQAAVLDLCLV